MRILTKKYLAKYRENPQNFEANLAHFRLSSKVLDFSYMIESSSVYSANIEGNSLNLNSFQNARASHAKPKEREEIESLIEAYRYAEMSDLSLENFLRTHALWSRTLLIESLRGKYRQEKVGVFGKTGLIYLAIEAEHVEEKMWELFADIIALLESDISSEEVFYYASLVHLVFIHIHPFADGNGRSARLLEKWFLATKLGKDFWKLSSEHFYKEHRDTYYQNINLWVNYYELDYEKSLPFLFMLPGSLIF